MWSYTFSYNVDIAYDWLVTYRTKQTIFGRLSEMLQEEIFGDEDAFCSLWRQS